MGLYLGGKLWMYWVWLHHVADYVSTLHTSLVLLATLPLWRMYLQLWLGDPGRLQVSLAHLYVTISGCCAGRPGRQGAAQSGRPGGAGRAGAGQLVLLLPRQVRRPLLLRVYKKH